MKDNLYTIIENTQLTSSVFKMKLFGDCSEFTAPGQFVNIKINGYYLRRPISVTCYEKDNFTIIYKVVGHGTEAMSLMRPGNTLMILAPLGNGYNLDKVGTKPLIIGGGVGVPPMFGLATALVQRGIKPKIILGFNTFSEIFALDDFKELGLDVIVTTADGSFGMKGFVTDAMKTLSDNYNYVCGCGPEPMLKAIYSLSPDGQFSFEARMACGFGGCMGCSCETKYGSKRICKDGPVLFKEEIIW